MLLYYWFNNKWAIYAMLVILIVTIILYFCNFINSIMSCSDVLYKKI